MSPRRLFNLLIALVVAAGLLSAPFAVPAIGKSHSVAGGGGVQAAGGDMHAMSRMLGHAISGAAMSDAAISGAAVSGSMISGDMMSGGMMSDGMMSDSMPCCPDDGKADKGCDCPLLALCAMTVAVPVPDGLAVLLPGEARTAAFAFPDDLLIDGLSGRPPDHPPRRLI